MPDNQCASCGRDVEGDAVWVNPSGGFNVSAPSNTPNQGVPSGRLQFYPSGTFQLFHPQCATRFIRTCAI